MFEKGKKMMVSSARCFGVMLLMTAFFVLSGCQNDFQPQAPDVYISGYTLGRSVNSVFMQIPCVWKNGRRTDLSMKRVIDTPHGSQANAVFIAGNDVFVSGFTCDIACLWKNGERIDYNGASSQGLFVSADDIYIVGQAASPMNSPQIWKNGGMSALNLADADAPFGGAASGVWASGGHVYVSGYYMTSSYCYTPCCWIDGQRIDLTSENAKTSAVFVDNGNLYVSGCIWRDKYPRPCYWKNGIRVDLSMADSPLATGQVQSISVSAGDVYAAGFTAGTAATVPCYWKNGRRIDLSVIDSARDAHACSICVVGDDVFVAGDSTNPSGIVVPCYWVNGVRTDLGVIHPGQSGFANSIFVVNH